MKGGHCFTNFPMSGSEDKKNNRNYGFSVFPTHDSERCPHRLGQKDKLGFHEFALKGTSVKQAHLSPAGHQCFKADLKSMWDLDCAHKPTTLYGSLKENGLHKLI